MGLSLSDAIHVVGQPIGWGAQAVGKTFDYVTPGKGSSTLTNAGKSITNPNMVFTGNLVSSGLGGGNAFSPVQHISQPPSTAQVITKGTTPISSDNSGYSLTGGSGSSISPTLTPDQQAYYGQLFDTQIRGLQGQLDQLPQSQSIANLQLQQNYQDNMNQLQGAHDQGVRDLGIARDTVNRNRAMSLDDIAKQVEQMGMSYNNQLGAYGAGNSSAAGLIQQALAGQAAKNRQSVLQGSTDQLQAIGNQQNDLETQFQQQHTALDHWKQSQAAQIMDTFNQQMRQLQESIVNAQGDKAQYLANYQPQLVQQAIDGLSKLQSVYNDTSQSLIKQYQNAAGPNFQIDKGLGQFQVHATPAGSVAGVDTAPLQQVAYDPVAALLQKRQDQNNPLGV